MSEGWDDELVIRQESLKCRICKGTNPYICRCARDAWYKNQRVLEQQKELDEYRKNPDNQWASYKGLICSPSMKACPTCVPSQSESFCNCAKQRWLQKRQKVNE